MTASIHRQNFRLFIALPLPTALKEVLQECQQWLASYPEMKVIKKWVTYEKFHITLHFLGDTLSETIPLLERAIKQLNTSFVSLPLTLKGIDTFETHHLPTVIWAGVEPNDALEQLHAQLASILNGLGIATTSQTFTPHVTLAYIRASDEEKLAIKKRLSRILVGKIGSWEVSHLHLMNSLPTHEGVVYRIVV